MGSNSSQTSDIRLLKNVIQKQSQLLQTNAEIISKLFEGLAISNEGKISTSIYEL